MDGKEAKTTAKKRKALVRTYSLSPKHFIESKAKGDEGEDIVFGHFAKQGYPSHRMLVPEALSMLPFPTEAQRLRFIGKFKDELLIVDGYVKIDGTTYGVEAQWKRRPNFVVDKDKYEPLWELSKVLPIRVYFYISTENAIYYHNVRDPRSEPPLEAEIQCGQRVYKIPIEELVGVLK